jgi:hypothetical protein
MTKAKGRNDKGIADGGPKSGTAAAETSEAFCEREMKVG